MEPLELSPAYGFKWECGYGFLETGVQGFSIHITPENEGASLTLRKVKKLEKTILKPTVLSHRDLIVMPHCADKKVKADMIWSLNNREHWSTKIR